MRRLALGLAILLGGCGRKAAPAAADAQQPTPIAASVSGKVVEKPDWTLHLDVKRMRATEALALWRLGLALPGSPTNMVVSRMIQVCGFGVDGVDEISASGRGGWWALVARPAVAPEKALACAKSFNNATDAKLDERPAVEWAYGEQLAVVADGLLYYGERSLLRELLAQRDAGGGGAVADEVLAYRRTQEGVVTGAEVRIGASDTMMIADGRIVTVDEISARAAATAASDVPDGVSPVRAAFLKDAVTVETSPFAVHYRVVAARDLADAAAVIRALAMHAISSYLRLDKTTEARSMIEGALTRLAAIADAERKAGRPARFPPSTGPLPSAVPSAARFKIPALTKPWAPFEGVVPYLTFYQYEVVVRSDGLTATAIARGDLDGDGVLSLFEQTLALDATGTPRRSPIKITAPLE